MAQGAIRAALPPELLFACRAAKAILAFAALYENILRQLRHFASIGGGAAGKAKAAMFCKIEVLQN